MDPAEVCILAWQALAQRDSQIILQLVDSQLQSAS